MDFAGLHIGHATNAGGTSGCTVFLCPPETVASVDVRGPAPGTRETALMGLDKPVTYANAVCLAGGSAFGLAAADGVMRYLAEKGIGHPTPIRPIPIVPAAIVYDLFLNQGQDLPDAAMGYAACQAATADPVAQGNVGAGAGVTVGKWGGPGAFMKGGFGLARRSLDGLVVAAAAVVNAIGDVVTEDGSVLAGARTPEGGWRVEQDPWRRMPTRPPANLTNTTLAVVATNARLDKVLANRLAQRAHDALAIAIRPVHTTHDGDAAFALATGQVAADFDLVAALAVDSAAQAIRNSVRHAATVGSIPGLAG